MICHAIKIRCEDKKKRMHLLECILSSNLKDVVINLLQSYVLFSSLPV